MRTKPATSSSLENVESVEYCRTDTNSLLSEMDGELAVLDQRQAKTRTLKQGIMQELLTGRTRLRGSAAIICSRPSFPLRYTPKSGTYWMATTKRVPFSNAHSL